MTKENKREWLINKILAYLNYPFYLGKPVVIFDESYINVQLFCSTDKYMPLYNHVQRINDKLKAADIDTVEVKITANHVITIYGLDTDEKAEQIFSLLRIKGVLK